MQRVRGMAMRDAAALSESEVGMTALLGVSSIAGVEAAVAAVTESRSGVVAVANYNSPSQVVLSGHAAVVTAAAQAAQAAGHCRRTIPLRVSAPFHSPLMQPVVSTLTGALGGPPDDVSSGSLGMRELSWLPVALHESSVPVVSNVDGSALLESAAIAHGLVEQVTRPVRWVTCVATARATVEAATPPVSSTPPTEPVVFVEAGPGRTLAGLVSQCDPSIVSVPAGDCAALTPLFDAWRR